MALTPEGRTADRLADRERQASRQDRGSLNRAVAAARGTSIELIPHVFGAARRPTDERGFYLHWRTGSGALVADAFRLSNYST
jgi:predicted phage gp36 major capsid-like protein